MPPFSFQRTLMSICRQKLTGQGIHFPAIFQMLRQWLKMADARILQISSGQLRDIKRHSFWPLAAHGVSGHPA